jgi:glucose-6-phosphate isomerase
MLLANVFAQAEALAFGNTAEQVRAEGTADWLVPHRLFEGNRPSNMQLLNLLGKILAQRIIPELQSATEPALTHDSSTNALINRSRALKLTTPRQEFLR